MKFSKALDTVLGVEKRVGHSGVKTVRTLMCTIIMLGGGHFAAYSATLENDVSFKELRIHYPMIAGR